MCVCVSVCESAVLIMPVNEKLCRWSVIPEVFLIVVMSIVLEYGNHHETFPQFHCSPGCEINEQI